MWSFSGFPTKTLYAPPLSPIRASRPAQPILLQIITRIMFGEEYRWCCCSLFGLLHSPVTSCLLGQNIFLNTPFSKTLSLYSSLSVKDQVSHPYKTTGQTIHDEVKQSNLKAGCFISQGTALYVCLMGVRLGPRASLDALEPDKYGNTEPRLHSRLTGSLITRPNKVQLRCVINNHNRLWHETAHYDVC
jgi:hypothetical protein